MKGIFITGIYYQPVDMIPQYVETIRYITMKLDENERSSITRLMKVKDMMIQKAIEQEKERDMGR